MRCGVTQQSHRRVIQERPTSRGRGYLLTGVSSCEEKEAAAAAAAAEKEETGEDDDDEEGGVKTENK